MATINADFVTYVGDAVSPIFTVVDANNNAVDISTVTQITWSVRRNLSDAIALTKTKTGGGVSFVSNGTDGKFQVTITGTDTAALSGNYVHFASITDAGGNVTTVTVGAMIVGLAPIWTYDPGLVGTESLYTVRRIIGDTQKGDQILFDAEIQWAINSYSNVWLAAAECARNIWAKYARDVDTQQGELRTLYSSRAKAYRGLAVDLEARGMARGGAQAYAGGISQSDKDSQVVNADRVAPQFNIGMMDNLLPIGPVGHETPGTPQSETGGLEAGEIFGQP